MTTSRHLAWAAGALAALATSFAARPAHACSSHGSGHYYEIMYDVTNDADHGASVAMSTKHLSDGSPSSSFVNHEMWYGVDGAAKYWVEVGVKDGITYAGNSVNQVIFWADNRNGGGYHEHYPNVSWQIGPYYELKITWAGNDSWNVYFGGIDLGTSTHNYNGGATRALEAGIEAITAHANDHIDGYMNNPKRKDANDHWYNGWQTPSFIENCPGDVRRIDSLTIHEVLHGPA